jgi:ribosome-associated protein
MTVLSKEDDSEHLLEVIIEGIDRKKGLEIINIDLHELGNTECRNFIICHGNSSTHVEAIARSVEETVEELHNEKVWHKDGYRNAQWILLDYSNIMVHIFQEPFRKFYDLENLWADARIIQIESKTENN